MTIASKKPLSAISASFKYAADRYSNIAGIVGKSQNDNNNNNSNKWIGENFQRQHRTDRNCMIIERLNEHVKEKKKTSDEGLISFFVVNHSFVVSRLLVSNDRL